jgi:hypothetical protein
MRDQESIKGSEDVQCTLVTGQRILNTTYRRQTIKTIVLYFSSTTCAPFTTQSRLHLVSTWITKSSVRNNTQRNKCSACKVVFHSVIIRAVFCCQFIDNSNTPCDWVNCSTSELSNHFDASNIGKDLTKHYHQWRPYQRPLIHSPRLISVPYILNVSQKGGVRCWLPTTIDVWSVTRSWPNQLNASDTTET